MVVSHEEIERCMQEIEDCLCGWATSVGVSFEKMHSFAADVLSEHAKNKWIKSQEMEIINTLSIH